MLLSPPYFFLWTNNVTRELRRRNFQPSRYDFFHVNRIETQNDNVCLPFCWSWSGGLKREANRIRKHWFWRLRYMLHTTKCTFMSWLFDSLDLPSRRKDIHRLMCRVDYGFNQWLVVSFAMKKLYVSLFMMKQCIYLVIFMCFMQIYFHLLRSENKFTNFAVFLNFLLILHATWIAKFWEYSKSQDKTQFENKWHKSDY